jgi:hypothetical protein
MFNRQGQTETETRDTERFIENEKEINSQFILDNSLLKLEHFYYFRGRLPKCVKEIFHGFQPQPEAAVTDRDIERQID